MRSAFSEKLNLKTEEAGALVLAPASDFRSQQKIKQHTKGAKPECRST